MTLAIGLNDEAPASTAASWGQRVQIGVKCYRVANPQAADYAKAHSLGLFIMPMITGLSDAGIAAAVALCYAGGGGAPTPGWNGMMEFGNETYLPSGVPKYANGTLYANAFKNGAHIAMAAHPTLKLLAEMDYTHQSAWLDQIWAAMGAQITDLYGIAPHNYTAPYGSSTSGDPVNGSIGIVAQLTHYNTALKAKKAANANSPMNIVPTEQGWATVGTPPSMPNWVPSEAIQADYYRKALAIYGNPANYVPGWACNLPLALFFELRDNPFKSSGDQEGHFGLTRSTTASFGQASAPASEHKAAWDVVAAAAATSGSPDFTGSTGGSGGSGTGGGVGVSQVTIALDPANQAQVLVSNIDASTVTLRYWVTQKPTYAPGDALKTFDVVKSGGSFPSAFSSPDPAYLYINVGALDASGNIIGQPFDAIAPRVQTFQAPAGGGGGAADAPVAGISAIDTITPTSAVVHGTADAGNQPGGTELVNYGKTTNYDHQTPPQAFTGGGSTTQPTHVASAQAASHGVQSVTIPNPSTPGAGQNGHTAVALVSGRHTGTPAPTLSPPVGQGWTLVPLNLGVFQSGTLQITVSAFIKTLGSSEPSSYTFTSNAAVIAPMGGFISEIADFGSIDTGASKAQANAAALSLGFPSIAVQDDDLALAFGVYANGESVAGAGWPAGWTERADVQSGATGDDIGVFGATNPISADGTTGAIAVTSDNAHSSGADTSLTGVLLIKPVSGAGAASFSTPLTGLAPATLYHVQQLVATPGGTDDALATFTTSAGAGLPAITDEDPTALTPTSVRLHANIDPRGATTAVSLRHGPDQNYGTTVATTPSSVTSGMGPTDVYADITVLNPAAIEHYSFEATNSAGTTDQDDQTLQTPGTSCLPKFTTGQTVTVVVATAPDVPSGMVGRAGKVTYCDLVVCTVAILGEPEYSFDPADLVVA